jgi:competence protein ComEC
MFSWHAIPFARILAPFVTGVIISFYYPSGLYIPLAFCGCCIMLLIFFKTTVTSRTQFRLKAWQGVLWTLCFLLLGYIKTYTYNETRQSRHYSSIPKARFYSVTVDDAVTEKARFYRCYAQVNAIRDSMGNTYRSQGRLLLYINRNYLQEKPMIGDRFIVSAHAQAIEDPPNPAEFNFRKYLSYKNIHFQLFADSLHTVKSGKYTSSIYRSATIFRDQCLGIICRYIPSPQEQGVAEALLLGYKDDLDPAITLAFSRTGTLHVLAVSGLHAGIIFLLISLLTKSLENKKRGKWIQLAIILMGLWFYAFMTGLSSSVLRASVMFSIMSIGKAMRHKPNIFNTLYASAFLLLLYNPLYIFDVGFQLSYLAVIGIIWIQPMISNWYQPRYKTDKYLWDLVSISLAAQVLTFPISLFYFHQFPNYFILSNMLIIPLTSLILIGLIVLLTLSWIPFAALWIGKILHVLIWFSNWLVVKIDKLPYSFINGFNLDIFQLLILFSILILLISFFIHRKSWILFCFMSSALLYAGTLSVYRYRQNRQRIMVSHIVKGHDVFTCIEGRSAWIISDSLFLRDESAIRFFIEPFLWEKGIHRIHKIDFEKDATSGHLKMKGGVGFQFFDKTMTNGKSDQYNGQNSEWIVVSSYQRSTFSHLIRVDNHLIISNKTPKKAFRKMQNEFSRDFGKKLSRQNKAFITHF